MSDKTAKGKNDSYMRTKNPYIFQPRMVLVTNHASQLVKVFPFSPRKFRALYKVQIKTEAHKFEECFKILFLLSNYVHIIILR